MKVRYVVVATEVTTIVRLEEGETLDVRKVEEAIESDRNWKGVSLNYREVHTTIEEEA